MNTFNKSVINILTVACISLAFFTTGCSSEIQKSRIQTCLQDAEREANLGKTEKAKALIDRAIKIDPNDINTYVPQEQSNGFQIPTNNITLVLSQSGNDRLLETYLLQARKSFPNDYRPLVFLMNVQQRLGETAALTETCKALIPIMENKTKKSLKSDYLVSLGTAYWYSGDQVKAEQVFQRALNLYSATSNPYNTLAYIYADSNDTAKLPDALKYANKALSIAEKQSQNSTEEDIAAILDTIGWVEYRQGDYKIALVHMQQALSKAPLMAESHYHLGMIYLALNDKESAKGSFTRATYICPDYVAPKAELEKLKNITPPAEPSAATAVANPVNTPPTAAPAGASPAPVKPAGSGGTQSAPAVPATPAKPMAPANGMAM